MKHVNYVLLYQENSDGICTVTARFFHDLDNAKEAMDKDFAKQDAKTHFPANTSDGGYDDFTDKTDMSISVNMGGDSYTWEITEAKPEDDDDEDGAEGVCPVCGAHDLEYGVAEITDTGVDYPWECRKCHATGTECFNREFVAHIHVEEN